jgi:hypothetical protein
MRPDWAAFVALLLLLLAAFMIPMERVDLAQLLATAAVVSAVLSTKK